MTIDPKEWRPITFQEVTFPATLMASSVLLSIIGIKDEDLAGWLFRLTTCRGVTKRAPAERCAQCAEQLLNLMLEQRQRVLDLIRDRLASDGFDVDETYRDWIMAFKQIIEISTATDGDCSWSAPSYPGDAGPAEAKRFLDYLDKLARKLRRDDEKGSGS